MEFKGSVRCDFHREMGENREQKRECLRKPLIHSQKGLPKGICPKSRATGVFSFSLSHPTTGGCAKPAKVCIGLLLHVRVVRVVRGS